jgi:hypothetical protein
MPSPNPKTDGAANYGRLVAWVSSDVRAAIGMDAPSHAWEQVAHEPAGQLALGVCVGRPSTRGCAGDRGRGEGIEAELDRVAARAQGARAQ